MVTNEGRNNIIALAYIGGFAIVILTFFFNYVQQADKATDQVVLMVQKGVDNVTDSQFIQTETIRNLSKAVNGQLLLMEEEKETTRQNLALFLESFRNQSLDAKKDRQNQTNTFIKEMRTLENITIEQSNLTRHEQQLDEARLALENKTAEKLDQLIAILSSNRTQ